MDFNKILIVDDEKFIRKMLCEAVKKWSFVPLEASTIEMALELFTKEKPQITLLDINLPDGSGIQALNAIKSVASEALVIMISANVEPENTIAALKSGANDFITKPIDLSELRNSINSALNKLKTPKQTKAVVNPHKKRVNFSEIVGESPEMKELISLAQKVAQSNVSSLLLQGESGTGKDLIAKAIHFNSPRADKPFIAINCAAIPENLIESELFGFEKGSFTDAKSLKEGLFEQAKGGTIFLDEIGELELGLQAKLLRVLEEGTFRRIGGLKDIQLNGSIIAASNKDLRLESDQSRFRKDLYFRLSVIELCIPPLRDRGDDILLLADHFIKKFEKNHPNNSARRSLTPEVIDVFMNYSWVGNVRELRNAVERALILEEQNLITLKYLPAYIQKNGATDLSETDSGAQTALINLPITGISLAEVEDSLIQQALERTKGNVTRAGKLVNLSRDQMRYYLKKRRNGKSD